MFYSHVGFEDGTGTAMGQKVGSELSCSLTQPLIPLNTKHNIYPVVKTNSLSNNEYFLQMLSAKGMVIWGGLGATVVATTAATISQFKDYKPSHNGHYCHPTSLQYCMH